MALCDGLALTALRGLLVDYIECDAVNVVNDVNSCNFDSACALIEDVIELFGMVGGGSCCHIPRKGNIEAHTLASLGLCSLGNLVGDGNAFPIELFDVLNADLA